MTSILTASTFVTVTPLIMVAVFPLYSTTSIVDDTDSVPVTVYSLSSSVFSLLSLYTALTLIYCLSVSREADSYITLSPCSNVTSILSSDTSLTLTVNVVSLPSYVTVIVDVPASSVPLRVYSSSERVLFFVASLYIAFTVSHSFKPSIPNDGYIALLPCLNSAVISSSVIAVTSTVNVSLSSPQLTVTVTLPDTLRSPVRVYPL